MDAARPPDPLALHGCALTALSTGEEATNLRELQDRILRVPARSLYYHFWGRLLRPVLVRKDYVNDFGNWVGHELRDSLLAERLALVDPGDETDIETLRARVADLLEERLAENGSLLGCPPDRGFHFLEGQMVIFDTGARAESPAALARILPGLPPSSIYYHLIDARHRPPEGRDDLQIWLERWGEPCQALVEALEAVDVFFTPLPQLLEEIAALFHVHVAEEGA